MHTPDIPQILMRRSFNNSKIVRMLLSVEEHRVSQHWWRYYWGAQEHKRLWWRWGENVGVVGLVHFEERKSHRVFDNGALGRVFRPDSIPAKHVCVSRSDPSSQNFAFIFTMWTPCRPLKGCYFDLMNANPIIWELFVVVWSQNKLIIVQMRVHCSDCID